MIVKTCKHHGELTRDQLIKKGKDKKNEPIYRCKQCMKDLHDKYYQINKEIVLQTQREYKRLHPDKIALVHAKSAKEQPMIPFVHDCHNGTTLIEVPYDKATGEIEWEPVKSLK